MYTILRETSETEFHLCPICKKETLFDAEFLADLIVNSDDFPCRVLLVIQDKNNRYVTFYYKTVEDGVYKI